MAALAISVQILAGDWHGLNTLKRQPAKVAAVEGIGHTQRGAPLLLLLYWVFRGQAQKLVCG